MMWGVPQAISVALSWKKFSFNQPKMIIRSLRNNYSLASFAFETLSRVASVIIVMLWCPLTFDMNFSVPNINCENLCALLKVLLDSLSCDVDNCGRMFTLMHIYTALISYTRHVCTCGLWHKVMHFLIIESFVVRVNLVRLMIP